MDARRIGTLKRIALALALAAAFAGCGEDAAEVDDATPLEVVQTIPANGGAFAPTEALRVTFSKDVDPASVQEGVQVIGVAATVNYDAASRTATLTPQQPLTPGRAYTLVVSKVEGVDGSRLKNVVTVSFTVNS